MIFRDNLVSFTSDNKIMLMNLITFRRKLIPLSYKDLILSISNKKEKLNDDERKFIKSLEAEKQILPKETIDLYDQYLKDNMQVSSEEENIISPNIMLTYDCNCSCNYCYEKELLGHSTQSIIMGNDHIDKIDEFYKKYAEFYNIKEEYKVEVTGGEPLLSSVFPTLDYMFKKWNKGSFSIATNGINIPKFIDKLPLDQIRNFKISLDGTEKIHNKRRPMKNGGNSFRNTITGIETALSYNIPVTIKITTDRESILELPKLFEFLESMSWLNNPQIKIQLSGVFSIKDGIKLDDRFNTDLEMVNEFIKLRKQIPYINSIGNNLLYGISSLKYSLTREKNKKIQGGIYRCKVLTSPCYTFEPFGNIYMCSSFIGNKEAKLGTFYPDVNLNMQKVLKLRNRHVLSISKCKTCAYKLICKGGCPASSYLKTNDFMNPECSFYKNEEILNKSGEMFL